MTMAKKKKKVKGLVAILRDGSTLEVDDEVTTDFYPQSIDIIFVIESITSHAGYCESGFLVVVHMKDDPARKILGLKKEGREFPDGIDANHFKKVQIPTK